MKAERVIQVARDLVLPLLRDLACLTVGVGGIVWETVKRDEPRGALLFLFALLILGTGVLNLWIVRTIGASSAPGSPPSSPPSAPSQPSSLSATTQGEA